MNDRLKKATGSGGITEIPIASAETLGGIKIPADSGITITGSGNAYAYKPPAYSYDEVDTGEKWVDGKAIYRKCISVAALPNNTTLTAGTLASLDTLVSIHGEAKSTNQSGYSRPLPFVGNGSNDIRVDVSDYDVVIKTTTDWSSYSGILVLEYTKADPIPEEPTEENTEE
jgi:hypothetical protein